ncbi:endonuclease/exonuclease/phosphatase family protein [Pseudoalteromonas sp. SSDWG2]|uniref:endonuclease/exonuclease/phosphatase family protein n=1 Tax=Pseudoalteromonas sp. SSDWG2 TaxID=3139391 RepID=UPI003BACED92
MPSLITMIIVLFVVWQQSVQPHETPNNVNTVEQCAQLLTQPYVSDSQGLPLRFTLVSWNIYKAEHPQLLPDLKELAEKANILVLQESYDDPHINALKPYASFAPGYRSYRQQTGLSVLSDWQPQLNCRFHQREPWLRTPKASSVSRYPIESGGSLLVVNMHGINFTLGVNDYQQQLKQLTDLIALHQGPVIFAGDLNTWSNKRAQLIDRELTKLSLEKVDFTPDHRTTVFGLALDHVWLRGVNIESALTLERQSSDHNPLLVSLRITDIHTADDTH